MPHALPEPTPQQAAVTHMRASLLRGLRSRVFEGGGEAAWQSLVQELSPEGRACFLDQPSPRAWLPVAAVNELVAAYLKRSPEPGAIGRATAEDQLGVVHAWLLRLLNPSLLARQVPMIYGRDYRGGVVRLDLLEPGRAVFSVWATGLFPEWHTEVAPRWLQRGFELSGGGSCSAIHLAPEAGIRHRFEIAWSRA